MNPGNLQTKQCFLDIGGVLDWRVLPLRYYFFLLRLNPSKLEIYLLNNLKTQCISHNVSLTKVNHLVLFREIITVCSDSHTKHINTPCEQNRELQC